MPKWTDYTTKTEPADNDEVMVLDAAGKANKRLGLSALSDWIIGKIANKVFENLQTNNKTVVGAINELNSNTFRAFNLVSYDAISTDLKSFNYGIARYSSTANDAPGDDNGFLISLYRSEAVRMQIALSDSGDVYIRTANSVENFNEWMVYNKI